MADARNVVEFVPHEEATVAATAAETVATTVADAKPLVRAPKAPNVGDSIEKWEQWIARCEAYMKEKRIYHRPVESTFAAFKEKDIARYGAEWVRAVRWGTDVQYLKSVEIDWKWITYLYLKGRPPLFSRYTRHSYR